MLHENRCKYFVRCCWCSREFQTDSWSAPLGRYSTYRPSLLNEIIALRALCLVYHHVSCRQYLRNVLDGTLARYRSSATPDYLKTGIEYEFECRDRQIS